MGYDFHSKRFEVAVILTTLALCALLLAQGATSLVATKLLPSEQSPVTLNLTAASENPLPGSRPPNVQAILKRNMFDPKTGPLWPPKRSEEPEDAVGEEAEEEDVLAPGEMPPPCEGSLRVVAAVFSPSNPEWSFVQISSGSDAPLLYRPGNEIDGKQIDSVYPKAVFLKDSNKLCSLTIFEKGTAGGAAKPKAAAKAPEEKAPKAAARRSSDGFSQDDFDSNITKVSDTKYSVNRELLDKVLANQGQLMRSARVVPHEQNGEVVGVKLYGIRRKSLFGQLGLQNGDLLRTINGHNMGSPDSALEAYARLRGADFLSVAVTRRGQPVTLEYEISGKK